jgi:hypothetical protein
MPAMAAREEYTPEEQSLIQMAGDRLVAAHHAVTDINSRVATHVGDIVRALEFDIELPGRSRVLLAAALLGVEAPPPSRRHELIEAAVRLTGTANRGIAVRLVDAGWTPPAPKPDGQVGEGSG